MTRVHRPRSESWLNDWKLVPRGEWGAEEPREEALPLAPPVPLVMFTQTKTRTCKTTETCTKVVRKLQKRHMESRPDIGYNFLIGGDGRVYEGTGWVSNGILEAAPGGGEPPWGGFPEGPEPPPWDQVHGNFISIAFIGDHSEIFPRVKKSKYRTHKLPMAHPNQLYTPPYIQITKKYKLSQEVLRWLRDGKQVREDATVRWLKPSKWRRFIQKVRQPGSQEAEEETEEEAQEEEEQDDNEYEEEE